MFALVADDLVTAVEFDETSDFMAVGDKAGRICIFAANAALVVLADLKCYPILDQEA